ncbi:MAG TPA: hypothetical protein PKL73_12590 [Polyangiaceae bacterium]|nr:hypothetical protein [Polyangiaceae bacterium]
MGMPVTVTLGHERLVLEQARSTVELHLDRLKGLHVLQHPGGVQELFLAYEHAPGKTRVVRTNSAPGQGDFQAVVDVLVGMRPDIDLRAMPSREALKKMGVTSLVKPIMLMALPLVYIGLLLVFTAPMLIHGLDKGSQEVSVTELAAGQPLESRNLLLKGHLAAEYSMKKTIMRRGVPSSVTLRIPVVEPGWNPSMPVHAVLALDNAPPNELGRLARMDAYPCVVRDVLWEGLDSGDKKFFRDEGKLTLAKDVRLCRMRYAGGLSDMGVFSMVMGGGIFVLVIVMAVVLVAVRRVSRRMAGTPR